MITTPDGAIDIAGKSGPLGGPADQLRLAALRRSASVVLVGAGTVIAENYGPPSRGDLRIGVVTKSCALNFSSSLFASGQGFIVTTTTAPDVPVDSIRAGTHNIDFRTVIDQLPDGIVHVEGGPTLNAALFAADLVDAINLTVSPHLIGGRGDSLSRPPHTMRTFSLVSTEKVDNFAFLRYEKRNA